MKKLVWILVSLILVGCSVNMPVPTSTANIQLSHHSHSLEKIQNAKLIWSTKDVYVIWNKFDATLSARDGEVCFLGDSSLHQDKLLFCLDGQTGELLWKTESGIHSALEVTSDGVFVTYNSPAEAKKYDRETGIVEWSRSLGGSGSYYFYVVDNRLQISTNPSKIIVLDFDGNLIKEFNSGTTTYLSVHDETFIRLNGLVSMDTNTSEVKWEFRDMDNLFDFMPYFSEDKIFVRTGLQLGSVYALDRKSGVLLWETSGIISNVVHSSSHHSIYALRKDGKLVAFDDKTGNEQIVASFTSVPFILAGNEKVGGYQIAYDEDNAMLFLSLGDSGQLFAFKEE